MNKQQNPNKGGRCTSAVSGNSEFQPSAEAQFDAEITQSVLKPFKAAPTPNNTDEGAALSYPTMQNDNAAEGLRTIIEEMQTPIEQLNNETMKNDNGEQSNTPQNAAKEEKRKKFLKYRPECTIDHNEELKPDEFLFSWGGIGFATRQNIVSLKAQPGMGKTFALTAICSAFLTGNNGGLESFAQPHERVMFVDTEQTHNSTLKIVKRIKKDFPNTEDRLKLLNIRNVVPQERFEYIQFEAEEYKPTLIIVDGVADLIPGMDYNDIKEASAITAELTALAERNNAVVVTAIHANKNDDNARGWLGGVLRQKCDVELMIEYDKTTGQRLLKPTKTRDTELPSISFEIVNTEDRLGKARIIPLDEAQDVADTMKQLKKKREALEMLIGWGITDKAYTKQAFQERVKSAWAKEKRKDCSRQNYYAILQNGLKCGALRSELRKSGEETIEWIIIEN